MTKEQYIAQWYSLFTDYVNTTIGYIANKNILSQLSSEAREKVNLLKLLLDGAEVHDVENDLSKGIVTEATLERTERIYFEIACFIIDSSVKDDLSREKMKELAKEFEHHQKERTRLQLAFFDGID